MSEKRDMLLCALRDLLLPTLLRKGFEQMRLSDVDQRSDEMRFCFPFGYLRRPKGADLELLEIQLDKHGAPKFVLNAGVAPPEGSTVPWRHFSQSEARIASLSEWYRLHESRACKRWFGPSRFSLVGNASLRVTQAVERAIKGYAEVEGWFANGVVGPHMQRIGFAMKIKQLPRPG